MGIATKQCSKCGFIKPISEFWKERKDRIELHCWCKDCCRQSTKETMRKLRKNPEFKKREKEFRERRRDSKKLEIFELLGNECVRCEMGDFRCLQIDHVHGNGKYDVSRSKRGSETYYNHVLRRIKAGSKDYQLLCANCNWIKRYENKEDGSDGNCN